MFSQTLPVDTCKRPGRPATGIAAKAGGIETIEAPINVSNVMVIDGDGKATRVGYRRDEETGRNVRVSRRSGKDLK